jgi:hypothetical protein
LIFKPLGSDGRNKPVFMKQLMCIYVSGDTEAPNLLIKNLFSDSVPAYSIKDYLKTFKCKSVSCDFAAALKAYNV